jgi:hypothetical protein
MTVRSGRCQSCGEEEHGDRPCGSRPMPEIEMLGSGPCNCLPKPGGDWPACAYCGLAQAPGKTFCGFCGHRWVTAAAG